ncbi:hypothetical protein BDV18DRAFT_130484 [Aspergillus unguis]
MITSDDCASNCSQKKFNWPMQHIGMSVLHLHRRIIVPACGVLTTRSHRSRPREQIQAGRLAGQTDTHAGGAAPMIYRGQAHSVLCGRHNITDNVAVLEARRRTDFLVRVERYLGVELRQGSKCIFKIIRSVWCCKNLIRVSLQLVDGCHHGLYLDDYSSAGVHAPETSLKECSHLGTASMSIKASAADYNASDKRVRDEA